MEMIVNIVATECTPENDEKFNQWYNDVHIPLILKNPAIKKAARYRLAGEPGNAPQYLAIYEFESREALEANPRSPEFAAAIAEMQETWKDGGIDIKWAGAYEPIKTWEQ